jgi:hypothetical protein
MTIFSPLFSVLGAVTVVTDKLGNLLEENAHPILHLLLGVTATCTACLQQREILKPSATTTLKSVRQMVFSRLIQVRQMYVSIRSNQALLLLQRQIISLA